MRLPQMRLPQMGERGAAGQGQPGPEDRAGHREGHGAGHGVRGRGGRGAGTPAAKPQDTAASSRPRGRFAGSASHLPGVKSTAGPHTVPRLLMAPARTGRSSPPAAHSDRHTGTHVTGMCMCAYTHEACTQLACFYSHAVCTAGVFAYTDVHDHVCLCVDAHACTYVVCTGMYMSVCTHRKPYS